MRRLAPSLLTLWAVVCLLVPPVPVVHAHEGGHEPHTHGCGRTLHAPLLSHAGHDHPHEAPAHDDHGPCEDDDAPEPHVHGGDPIGARARARVCGLAFDGATGGATAVVSPMALLAVWTCERPVRPAPRRLPSLRPPSARAVDKLVELGRLLI